MLLMCFKLGHITLIIYQKKTIVLVTDIADSLFKIRVCMKPTRSQSELPIHKVEQDAHAKYACNYENTTRN